MLSKTLNFLGAFARKHHAFIKGMCRTYFGFDPKAGREFYRLTEIEEERYWERWEEDQ